MKLPLGDERRTDEAAAAWLQILDSSGPAEREAFSKWVKESPRHVRAFLLMTALDVELDSVDANKKLEAHLNVAQVVPFHSAAKPQAHTHSKPRWPRPWSWAAAVAALVAVGIAVGTLSSPRYVTAVGEQRAFDLSDGSVVYLNTDSQIALDFSERARDIRLLKGEALFKVARDNSRPFRVHTDNAVIQALGTQFNVRRDAYGTKVLVIEGLIRVADQTTPLTAGQEATIQRDAQVVRRESADVARVLAWRQRRLIFRTDTLTDIAAEFNRYNRAPQITLEHRSLGARRFSGVFDADDPESFAQVLDGADDLQIQRTEREILIRRKSTPNGPTQTNTLETPNPSS